VKRVIVFVSRLVDWVEGVMRVLVMGRWGDREIGRWGDGRDLRERLEEFDYFVVERGEFARWGWKEMKLVDKGATAAAASREDGADELGGLVAVGEG